MTYKPINSQLNKNHWHYNNNMSRWRAWMCPSQVHIQIFHPISHTLLIITVVTYRTFHHPIKINSYLSIIRLPLLISRDLRSHMKMHRSKNRLLHQVHSYIRHFKILIRISSNLWYNHISIHSSVVIKSHKFKWTSHSLNKQFHSALYMVHLTNLNFYTC